VRTTFISTASLLNTPRVGIARMQADLVRLNREVISGRLADVGLNLGAETGQSVTLHVDTQSLAALVRSNATVTTRLEQTQTALDQLRKGANTFLQQLVSNVDSQGSPAVIKQFAGSALAGFIGQANASDGHSYLFGGINSAVAPLSAYADGPQAAVDAAFLAKFGVAQNDPLASGISGADMADFLANEFAALFDDPQWGTTWSSAANEPVRGRISQTETIDTTVSANQPAMRKLAMVYTMVANLGIDQLGAEARQVVLDKAIDVLGDAEADLIAVQVGVGTAQNQVREATERLTLQQEILERRIAVLEGVDPAEAKVKIDTLTTQIEMSYSLTARLLRMSMLNYA
jgi:flagellar hook-associated protein 3 FlgL